MTLRYLIDTDWAIHYLNGHPQIVQRLKNLRNEGLGISVVSLAELYEHVFRTIPATHFGAFRPPLCRG